MPLDLRRLMQCDRIRAFLREIGGEATLRLLPPESAAEAPSGATAPGIDHPIVALPDGSCARLDWPDAPAGARSIVAAALRQLIASEYEAIDLASELSSQYEEITLLYDLSNAFSGTLRLEELQHSAIQQIAATLGVRRISLLMLDEERTGLILTAGLGVNPSDLGTMRFKAGKSLAWQVVETNRSLIANDLSTQPDYVPSANPERALLLVPLASKRGLIGVLTVADKTDGTDFDSKDEKLLAAIASQMGAVWENARLYKETKELFFNTVEALSAAIDAKDPYTHGHSRRVTEFSTAIAEELGMVGDELERIRISAMLHDIGKLGVDDAILRKPDRLTNDEFGQIKKHPGIGAEIMGRVTNLARFTPGMVDHHEKFDGSGYPEGRKGDQISLAGRIIAVADTFDAITSNRPYHPDRKGKPAAVALAELERCLGTHFDPAVVGAFIRAHQQGRIKADSDQ